MLTSWYVRSELPFRIAILYAGNTLSNCFGGLIAAGVLKGMEGVCGIRAWRWLFILEGSVTIAIALVAAFILPNYPKSTLSILYLLFSLISGGQGKGKRGQRLIMVCEQRPNG